MSSELSSITGKSNYSKNIIKYSVILITFLVALWLSSQSEGPSKMPKVVTDEFTFTAWVNDGEDDCDNGEDEGVDVSDYEHDVYSMVQNYRYVIEGDYLYMGLTSYTVTQDGSSNTMTVDEENMCSEGAI